MSEKLLSLDLGKKLFWLEIQRFFFDQDGELDDGHLDKIMDLTQIKRGAFLPGLTRLSPTIVSGLAHYFQITVIELIEIVEALVDAGYLLIAENGSLLQTPKSQNAQKEAILGMNKEAFNRGKCAIFTQRAKMIERIPSPSDGEKCANFTQKKDVGSYISSLSSLKNKNLKVFKGGVGGKTVSHEFETLWELWPRKKDHDRAEESYRRLRKNHALMEIERAVEGYLEFLKSQRIHKHFEQEALYLSTFLNKNRWKEYLEEKYEPSL